MTKTKPRNLKLEKVQQLADVPDFASEDEEHQFWSTHELGEDLLKAAQPLERDNLPPPRPRTRSVAVRFDDVTLQRIRALAARRHQGYRALIKQLVTERLDEEDRRAGTLG